MLNYLYNKPDWVMLGVSTVGGVMLLASKTLTQAQLEVVHERSDYPRHLYLQRERPWSPRMVLSCEFGQYVVITGKTYAEAFRHLFNEWEPDRSQYQQIENSTREVEQYYG